MAHTLKDPVVLCRDSTKELLITVYSYYFRGTMVSINKKISKMTNTIAHYIQCASAKMVETLCFCLIVRNFSTYSKKGVRLFSSSGDPDKFDLFFYITFVMS